MRKGIQVHGVIMSEGKLRSYPCVHISYGSVTIFQGGAQLEPRIGQGCCSCCCCCCFLLDLLYFGVINCKLHSTIVKKVWQYKTKTVSLLPTTTVLKSTDERPDIQADGQTNGPTYGRTSLRQINRQRWPNKRTDRQTDGWTEGMGDQQSNWWPDWEKN